MTAAAPQIGSAAAALRTFDVVVLGGGLAGCVAAKKAAEAGKRVALVREGGGATAHSSGAFDIVSPRAASLLENGVLPPLRAALDALLRANPHHPYALVGAGDGSAVMGLLEEATDDLFRDLDEEGLLYRGSLARNLWLGTPGGHVKESAFAQEAISAGDLAALPKARIAVVSVSMQPDEKSSREIDPLGLAHAKARAAALRRSLDSRSYFGVRELIPVSISTRPRGAGRAPDECTIARALDDGPAAQAWAKEVAHALETQAPRATHVLFPPLLGLREPGAVVAIVKVETGREVCETVSLPPSVPGLRLERALLRVVERKGVTILTGRAVRAEAALGAIKRVTIEEKSGAAEPVEARAFVLTAGRYLGGGLREANRAVEPLFDLPLHFRGRPAEDLEAAERFGRHVVGPHPALGFGVRCASDLRPFGRSGGPAFDNLFAAGAVMEGGSFAADRAGLGVALATGYVAGLNAAEAV